MWKNFHDVRSMAEKLTSVVAPRRDDDDDDDAEEYSEDGGEEFEDEVDFSESEEAAEETAARSPFGLVGMLARAMDSGPQQKHDEEESHSIEYGVSDDERADLLLEEKAHCQPDYDPSPVEDSSSKIVLGSGRSTAVPEQRGLPPPEDLDIAPDMPLQETRGHASSRKIVDGAVSATQRSELSPRDRESEHEPEPARFSLVRESGSLSPLRAGGSRTGSTPLAMRSWESTTMDAADGLRPFSQGPYIPFAPLDEAESGNGDATADTKVAARGGDSGFSPMPSSASGASLSATAEHAINEGSEGGIKKAGIPELSRTKVVAPTPLGAPPNDSTILETTNGERSISGSDEQVKRMEKLEKRCKELKKQLGNAENHIIELQQQTTNIVEHDNSAHEKLIQQFHDKEARLLQAAAEEHKYEMQSLRRAMEESVARQLIDERSAFQQDRERMDILLAEANSRADEVECQGLDERNNIEKSASQTQQQQARALRMAEDKLAHTMALLDERDENTKTLKEMIKGLESKLSEQKSGVQEAEEEMDELNTENEALHSHVDRLQAECDALRTQVTKLEGDSEKFVHLKMELRMLKEDHSREKAKVQNVAASTESITAHLESERDEALARGHDLQLQLSAALADLDIAKSDVERTMISNGNLQAALEAFQNEREAEVAMLEESRREQEEVMSAAHAAALDATHEANQAEIRQIQRVADAAVTHSMDEIKRLEDKLEAYRMENVQTRRSLDEAIKRLQATQDDVIDRTYMKNITLDWLMKTDRREKGQVLELMASVLHFSEAEKEKVHIDDGGGLRKLVAPPPSKADLDHLEGDNVREKWVNFLIAEAED